MELKTWGRILTVGIAVLALGGLHQSLPVASAAAPKAGKPAKDPFRNAVREVSSSIVRADLLACQQLGRARAQQPRSVDVGSLARLMTGTWVRELTWYGVQVQTESAMYFDFVNSKTALMFDQSNLGRGPLAARVEAIKNNPDLLAKTPTLTYVDCDYSMIDRYYKISDEFLFDGLPLKISASKPLESAWSQMQNGGFFERQLPSDEHKGSEQLMPSVGGAFWRTATIEASTANGLTSALMTMVGDYRFVHGSGPNADARFSGREIGRFALEGDTYVASKRALGSRATGSSPGVVVEGYDTDCAGAYALLPINYERVVLQPGI